MATRISLNKARVLLKAAMETQGRDFKYNTSSGGGPCWNTPAREEDIAQCGWGPDEPKVVTGCLVGTAMKLSGKINDMSKYRHGGAYMFAEFAEQSAIRYFEMAQVIQDSGYTWGEAYDVAEAEAARYLEVGYWRTQGEVLNLVNARHRVEVTV